MDMPIIQDIAIILGLSIVVLFISYKLKIPPILAYLFTGFFVGPTGFGLIHAKKEVEHLAEIGVILLLFTIGLEFSFSKLAKIKTTVLVGGGLQVGLTIFGTYGILSYMGQPGKTALFAGFLLALSSTAIVLKLLQERGEMETPQGQATLAILIFQDIVIVPMMLLTPILAGQVADVKTELINLGLKTLGIIVVVIVGARWLVPYMLDHIANTRKRELFLLTICAMGLAITWLTSWAGLSLGLGAFLAGLIISESEYSHHALSSIMPFRDVFTSFFFVSIGMLMDLGYFRENLFLVLGLTLLVVVLKAFFTFGAIEILGMPIKISSMVSLNLAQIGEFSFILSSVGLSYGLLEQGDYQLFLAVSVTTLAITPLLVHLSTPVAEQVNRLPVGQKIRLGHANRRIIAASQRKTRIKDHLVIIGFGLTGEMLSEAAKYANTRFVVLEMNPHTVRKMRAQGVRIYYGDATHTESLELVGINAARIVVVAIPDVRATEQIVHNIRRMNSKIYIIARTRFTSHIKTLYSQGADAVIPTEYETAIEIFARVLRTFMIPQEEIASLIINIRKGGYEMFRSLSEHTPSKLDLSDYLRDLDIRTFRVHGESPLVGKTLSEANLRKEFGVTALVLRREGQTLANPKASEVFRENDLAVLMGTPKCVCMAAPLFKDPQEVPLECSLEDQGVKL